MIKVEAVQRPDGIRFSAAVRPAEDPMFYEMSALFHASNLGKRGITLDLSHPAGLELARDSLRGATSSSRTSRRGCSNSSASTTTRFVRCGPTW